MTATNRDQEDTTPDRAGWAPSCGAAWGLEEGEGARASLPSAAARGEEKQTLPRVTPSAGPVSFLQAPSEVTATLCAHTMWDWVPEEAWDTGAERLSTVGGGL